jgi:MFS family permease
MSSHAPLGVENAVGYSKEQQPYSVIRKQLIILGITSKVSVFILSQHVGLFPLSEAIAWTTVFSYIYSMVPSFSSSSDSSDQNAAIYAGIMVSVFTFGEFIMAPQWARISGRIGTKPTLI